MSPEEPTIAELGWRIAAMEKRVDEGMLHIERRIDSLQSAISTLGFVPRETYVIQHQAVVDRADAAYKLAMTVLGILTSLMLGAIVTAVVAVAKG